VKKKQTVLFNGVQYWTFD